MNDLFVELLSICIDRLADGDTVADCLADFPECPELGPLLETAALLLAEGRPGGSGGRPGTAPPRFAGGELGDDAAGGGLALPWSA